MSSTNLFKMIEQPPFLVLLLILHILVSLMVMVLQDFSLIISSHISTIWLQDLTMYILKLLLLDHVIWVGALFGDLFFVENLGDSRRAYKRRMSDRNRGQGFAQRLTTDHDVAVEEVRKKVQALHPHDPNIFQDEKLLAAGKLDLRLEIVVVIRSGEKIFLEQIDAIFKDRELELDELEYYQERRLKDLGLVGE